MLVKDLVEMTLRTGRSLPELDNYDFENLSVLKYKFVGKMQHGYGVYVSKHEGTFMYIVKDDANNILTMTQAEKKIIPKIGQVYETLNSKTNPKYSGNLLNYKLKYFLVHHLGYKVLLGKVHSLPTENILKKIQPYFSDMCLVNTKTGEVVKWSYDKYLKLSSIGKSTDWQVLLLSTQEPFKESMINLPGFISTRHAWTYADRLFEDCK